MPGKKQRNPFEDHINSESFDVSNLGAVQERSAIDMEMEEFFASLPDELNFELWDKELDDRQKVISAYLATELAERILRDQHSDLLEDHSDAQLIELLTVPVTLAMIAEQRLHQPEQKKEEYTHPLNSYRDDFSELPPNPGEVLKDWFLKAKDFIISLFRRN